MILILTKILPVTEFKPPLLDVSNAVLPLLKISKTIFNLTIEEACTILQLHLNSFIHEKYQDPQKLQSSLLDVDTYFINAKAGTLYENPLHMSQIQKILRIIASYLDHLDPKKNIDTDPLFYDLIQSIESRACFDQHAYNLNALLIQLSFSQFSPPIQRVLQHIHLKMQAQISFQLSSLDQNIFKGFTDLESVHSTHIVYMILDDIFGVAGGEYANTEDLLINRNPVLKEILKRLFNNKLTIQHLLSCPNESWQSSLARDLSCDTFCIGESPISMEDLSKAPHFINFLLHQGLITVEQKRLLEHPESILDDNELDFFKPLATISTELCAEKIVYTPLFAQLLIQFILEKIYSSDDFKTCVESTIAPFSIPNVPLPLSDKIVSLFSMCSNLSPQFSYNEISFAMLENNVLFHTPFLKPHLSLSTLMMAHCHPRDSKKIFNKWILPNAKLAWAHDCLLMMGSMNYDSIMKIGMDVFTDSAFTTREGGPNLLYCLIYRTPQTLTKWFQNKMISSQFLSNSKTHDQIPFLHFVSDFHPYLLDKWVQNDYIPIHILKTTKDDSDCSVLHWISVDNSDLLESWILKGLLKICDLSLTKDGVGDSVLHWLASLNERLIPLWLQKGILSITDLISTKDDIGNSLLHFIINYHPKILITLIDQKLIDIDLLKNIKNDREVSLLHFIAYQIPDIIDSLLKDKLLDFNDLKLTKNISHQSVLHWIAQYCPLKIELWLEKKLLSAHDLIVTFDNRGSTILHWIAKHHPETIQKWVDNKQFTIQELSYIKNHHGESVLHFIPCRNDNTLDIWLKSKQISIYELMNNVDLNGVSLLELVAKFNVQILSSWVETQAVSISNLANSKDIIGNTLLHMIAHFYPLTLQLWVEMGFITVKELIDISNDSQENILHFLAQFQPKTLELWFINGIIKIEDLSSARDSQGSTVIHLLAIYYPKLLELWVNDNHISVQELIKFKTDHGITVVHLLAQYQPQTLQLWLNHKFVSYSELLNSRTNDNLSFEYFLNIYSPQFLAKLKSL